MEKALGVESSLRGSPKPSRAMPDEPIPKLQISSTREHLRHLVQSCSTKNHLKSAIFYGDKLVCCWIRNVSSPVQVSISRGAPEDVWLFAQTLFRAQEYHRAIHLINQFKMIDGKVTKMSLECRHLVTQCLVSATDQLDLMQR